jgi:Peptidase family M28
MNDLQTLCDGVDGPGMMRQLETLAQWVKLSGTEEEATSLRHIQIQLDELGFRTRLLHHDAYISLPGASTVTLDNVTVPSITHSFSRMSADDGLTGRLAYVGAGNEADFVGHDLRGCIVLVDGIATPPVSRRATIAGAAGQLHISPHEQLHEMCISPVWGNPSSVTVEQLPGTVVCSILPGAGDPLRERVRRGEEPRVVMRAEVDTGWRKTPILQADMDAPDPDAPFILFSGHHDTWYYGVMDNGSANVSMLEVARLCASKREQWRRGLRLCFWSGHSHGRYSGSTWYVDEHWDELDQRCAVHLNVDSPGAKGADILGNVGSMAPLFALASEAILAQSGQTLSGKRMSRGADQSFNGLGLPALFGDISEPPPTPIGAHCWWWHTPHDLLENIDEANQVRDTRICVHALWRLLTDRVLPLDFKAHAWDLLAELARLAADLRGRFSLADLIVAAETTRDLAGDLNARAATADAARIDRALMHVSRALVPMDYTTGDRFTHDPALPLPTWAGLIPIRTLAAAPAGSDTARYLTVEATRARNRLLHALRRANGVLTRALGN